jgi:hypothetical protein
MVLFAQSIVIIMFGNQGIAPMPLTHGTSRAQEGRINAPVCLPAAYELLSIPHVLARVWCWLTSRQL